MCSCAFQYLAHLCDSLLPYQYTLPFCSWLIHVMHIFLTSILLLCHFSRVSPVQCNFTSPVYLSNLCNAFVPYPSSEPVKLVMCLICVLTLVSAFLCHMFPRLVPLVSYFWDKVASASHLQRSVVDLGSARIWNQDKGERILRPIS